MNDQSILEATLSCYSILQGEFGLVSGKKSHYFVDAQRALLTRRAFDAAGNLLAELCDEHMVTAIGGPATGAISPVCAALSKRAGLKGFYVDLKKGKVSGQVDPRDRALMVDDVVTTGWSLGAAMDCALDKEGVETVAACAVVDRREKSMLFDLNVPYRYLVDARSLIRGLA